MLYIEIILYFLVVIIGLLAGLYIGLTIVSYMNERTENRRYGYSRKKSRQIEKQREKEKKEKEKEKRKQEKEAKKNEKLEKKTAATQQTVHPVKDTDEGITTNKTAEPASDHPAQSKNKNLLEERLPENDSYSDFVCGSMGKDQVEAIRTKRKSQDQKYIGKTKKKQSGDSLSF